MPLVLAAKALAPTAVFVETLPAPRPTVSPWIEASNVPVNVVNLPVLGVVPPIAGGLAK